jgi:hypothetical protein
MRKKSPRTAPRTIQARVIDAWRTSGKSKLSIIRKVPNLTPSTIVQYLNGKAVYMHEASLEQLLEVIETTEAK